MPKLSCWNFMPNIRFNYFSCCLVMHARILLSCRYSLCKFKSLSCWKILWFIFSYQSWKLPQLSCWLWMYLSNKSILKSNGHLCCWLLLPNRLNFLNSCSMSSRNLLSKYRAISIFRMPSMPSWILLLCRINCIYFSMYSRVLLSCWLICWECKSLPLRNLHIKYALRNDFCFSMYSLPTWKILRSISNIHSSWLPSWKIPRWNNTKPWVVRNNLRQLPSRKQMHRTWNNHTNPMWNWILLSCICYNLLELSCWLLLLINSNNSCNGHIVCCRFPLSNQHSWSSFQSNLCLSRWWILFSWSILSYFMCSWNLQSHNWWSYYCSLLDCSSRLFYFSSWSYHINRKWMPNW